jgi:hypothetical protein
MDQTSPDRTVKPKPTDHELMMARIDLQNKEFDAVEAVAKAYTGGIQQTAVVDNDYPAVRSRYESALRQLLAACKANGRTM